MKKIKYKKGTCRKYRAPSKEQKFELEAQTDKGKSHRSMAHTRPLTGSQQQKVLLTTAPSLQPSGNIFIREQKGSFSTERENFKGKQKLQTRILIIE